MRNRITKLLTLAATATALSFGATAVWANLVTLGTITGCVSSGGTGSGSYCKTKNGFDDLTESGETLYKPAKSTTPEVLGNGVFIKDYTTSGKFVVTARFATDDTFTLTFLNRTGSTKRLLTNTVMFFGGLQFKDGGDPYGLDLATLTLKRGETGEDLVKKDTAGKIIKTNQQLIDQIFEAPDPGENYFGENPTDGKWFKLEFNDSAVPIPKGTMTQPFTVVITAKLAHGVPEPGSLALLGAVLVAFGVVQIRRRPRS